MNTLHANYNVLVVDSSVIVVERIRQLLSELSCVHQVQQAYNYDEAATLMTRQGFDIVLLDTQLTDKNGFELLSLIKRSYPETKTIILTNQSGNYYRTKVQKIGFDHFIDKSEEFEKIVQIINNYSVGFQMN